MIIRATIAGVTADGLATRIHEAKLDATVVESIGSWEGGVERGATAEFAVPADFAVPGSLVGGPYRVLALINATLLDMGQQAAYLTIATDKGTRASLLWADKRAPGGMLERIG